MQVANNSMQKIITTRYKNKINSTNFNNEKFLGRAEIYEIYGIYEIRQILALIKTVINKTTHFQRSEKL